MVDPVSNPDDTEHKRVPARLRGAPWALVAVLLGAIVWLGWEAFGPRDYGDPVATSLAAFKKQNELTVFSAQLSPVVAAQDSRYFDLVQSRQVAVIPATVRYTLDMSRITAEDMAWDADTNSLNVTLPDLIVSAPNLDETRAQYLREGIWITREAQDDLTRQNSQLAQDLAMDAAKEPALMELARSAAREAVRGNLALPLQAAGFGEVQVNVGFSAAQSLTQ